MIPRPWILHPVAHLFFLSVSVFGLRKVLSSQIEEAKKKKWCTSNRIVKRVNRGGTFFTIFFFFFFFFLQTRLLDEAATQRIVR